MSTVYGPVPSRRLGQSLGVDPIPFKTCNYNCVYCQLGRTAPLTKERRDFFPPEDILAELKAALATHKPGEIDYITFVGQGEPLLCASLGRLLRGVKTMTDIPVALITNGSLLFKPEVWEEAGAADVVMPNVDAADERTFHRVNQAWRGLHIAEIIDGLVSFRETFKGQLWVEVMLVKDLNDSEEALTHISRALNRIRPDQVHLNVPIRPPAASRAKPPDNEGFIRAMAILGETVPIITPAEGAFELAENMPLADAIIEIIRRHPMQEENLLEALRRFGPDRIRATLIELEAGGQARRRAYRDKAFWQYAGGRSSAPTK